jgi:signal transduction histidine kinase
MRWPLRKRLAFLICVLLLVSVTVFGWAAYHEIEVALLEAANARLQSVSHQLVTLLAQTAQQRLDEGHRLAARPALVALMAAPDDAGALAQARAELDTFLETSPMTLGVELWSPKGAQLLVLSNSQSPFAAKGTPPPRTTAPHQVGLGRIRPFLDGAYYEMTVPLAPTPAPAPAPAPTTAPASRHAHAAFYTSTGYLLFRRQATTSTNEALEALIGNGISVALGSQSSKNGVWTDLSKVTPAPPLRVADGRVIPYTAPEGEARLGVGEKIQNTPWTLWVALPRAVALAPAGVFFTRVVPLGLLILLLGPAIAWIVARRMTQALAELTAAAESIAAGDHTRRVQVERDDEVGRLGESFNTMASRIEEDYHRLEDRVRDRTANLEQALAELHRTQEELVRREKLAMLGQLASGVGHELRNPLGVMTNAVYFLEMVQPDAAAVVKEYHGVLRSQIGLSEKIVSDLLDFARIKPPRCEPVPLVRVIDDQLARVPTDDRIRIVREIPVDLPPLHVDPVRLSAAEIQAIVAAGSSGKCTS